MREYCRQQSICHFLLMACNSKDSCTVYEILPHLRCKWLRVTLRSPSYSKKTVEVTFPWKNCPSAMRTFVKNSLFTCFYSAVTGASIIWFLVMFNVFGRNVTEKVGNQRCYNLLPHLISGSALPCETRSTEIAYFSLKQYTLGLQLYAYTVRQKRGYSLHRACH